MADICMCKGTDCPLKESCYRYTANKNEILQSYFKEPPVKDGKCEMYWGNIYDNVEEEEEEEVNGITYYIYRKN